MSATEFDYDKEAARFKRAYAHIEKAFKANRVKGIDTIHLSTAMDALSYCAQHERAMKLIAEAAKLIKARPAHE